MTRISLALILLFIAPSAVADDRVPVHLPDGTDWSCRSLEDYQKHTFNVCLQVSGPQTGLEYQGFGPLTADSLAAYQTEQERRSEEAACTCSREIHEGQNSGNGIICTGAFSPYLLRKRTTDPCAGAWEKP